MIFADAHEHEHSGWQEFLQVTTDPAHIGAELVFTLVFDLLIVFVGWKLLAKPWLDRHFNKAVDQAHAQIDAEHGYHHSAPSPGQGHVKVIEAPEDEEVDGT